MTARMPVTSLPPRAAPPPWRYELQSDFTHQSPHLAGIVFCNDWVLIDGGRMLIRAGYAWNGCDPALRLAGRLWLGTPDGLLLADGWRQTGRASLVHDAFCQFKHEISITNAATVSLFADMLRADGWPLWRLYAAAVVRFGPRRFAGD